MGTVTRSGATHISGIGISYMWSSEDVTDAPASAPVGAVGCGSTGGSTGRVFHFNGADWIDTTALVAGFYRST
jgi:hypothetical protein